jgi:ComF family protein
MKAFQNTPARSQLTNKSVFAHSSYQNTLLGVEPQNQDNHSMNSWLNRLLFTLLPGTCIICKAATHRMLDLCGGCQRSLPYSRHACWQCGLEMSLSVDVCSHCLQNPPVFSHCFALLRYEPPVDVLMSQFKTQHRLVVGKVLSILLAKSYLRHHLVLPDCWIPVPLHQRVKRSRGFNQADEIAQILTEFTGVPSCSRFVKRSANSLPQKQLSAAERATNIVGAFQVEANLGGQTVGIVDDVMTTGATASELSQQLLNAGAADVQIVCLARTPAN